VGGKVLFERNYMKELTNKLKKIRTEHQLSQESLAEIVGVTRQTIISIEKGSYQPSVGLAIKLAKALHKTVESLFYLK
jgi:putative transcriptional regulator